MPLVDKAGYHALIFNVKFLFASARCSNTEKSDRTTNWTATRSVALDLQQPQQSFLTICVTSLLGSR
jgi:hypothetical protein